MKESILNQLKERQNSAFKQLLKIFLKLHSFELETSRELPNFALDRIKTNYDHETKLNMEDYTWNTTESMDTNTDTMNDFIDNHMAEYCGADYEVVHEDGTYVEIQNDKHILYGVHALGNGDFCSHRVRFEELK